MDAFEEVSDGFEEQEETKFNAGIATLQRLHVIKAQCDACTINEEYVGLTLRLKAFYKELRPIILAKDKKRFDDGYATLLSMISRLKSRDALTLNDLNSIDAFELLCRELEQKYGLNLPYKQSARLAMLNRA